MPKLIPIVRAAKELGIPVSTVRYWIANNRLPFPLTKVGGRWYVDPTAVERYLSENERPAQPAN